MVSNLKKLLNDPIVDRYTLPQKNELLGKFIKWRKLYLGLIYSFLCRPMEQQRQIIISNKC